MEKIATQIQPSTRNSHKPTHKPKIAKELVCLPSLTLPTLKKLNLLKTRENGITELKNYLKPLKDKNAQLVIGTVYFISEIVVRKSCVSASNKHLCTLTVNRSQSLNGHIVKRKIQYLFSADLEKISRNILRFYFSEA